MLNSGKRWVAVILALILCVSMPLATFADDTPPEGNLETTQQAVTDPNGNVTTPPADDTTTPPAGDDTTTPPAGDDTTTPPAGDTTTPPAGDTTTPPADDTTTPPAEEDTTTLSPDDSASPATSDVPDESASPEPSETPEEEIKAVQPPDVALTLGQTQQLSLEGSFTQRCTVTLPSAGRFTLDVQVGSAEPGANATVRFCSGSTTTTYLSGALSESNAVHVGDWFDAGTYNVLITLTALNGSFDWKLNYAISTSFDSTSAVSGNGDLANARDLATGTSYTTGLLSRTNNVSWWKITLSSAGRLEIGLKSYVQAVEAYVLQLRDGQRTRHYIDMSVSGGTEEAPQYSTSGDWLEAGVYYLCVNGMDINTGLYGVMASFTAANNTEGDNNNYLKATSLTVNGGTMRCLLSQTDELDIFTFTLATRTTVIITARAYMNAMNLQLFNANMRTLLADASDSKTGGTLNQPHNHSITQTLDAGTYMIMASRDPEGPRGIFVIDVAPSVTIAALNLNASVFNKGEAVTVGCVITGKQAVKYTYQLQKQNAAGTYDNVGSSVESTLNYYSVIPGPGVDPTLDPTGAGVYRFEVQATDNYNKVKAYSVPFTYKDADTLAVTGLWQDRTTLSTQDKVTLTVGVSGGSGLKQAIFCIYDMSSNTQIDQVVSSTNVGVYQPKRSGTYKVMAVVTDGAQWASKWGTETFTVPPLAITGIAIRPENAATINRPLTITASYANTVPTHWVYEVYYCKYGENKFNFEERFSSSVNSFAYTPRKVGIYQFMVVATDGGNWTSRWSASINLVDQAPLAINAVTASKTSVTINETVNFTLSYSGGATVQLTEYQLYNSAGSMVDKWTGNSNTHGFAIATAGTYRVMAVAYDGVTWTAKFSGQITVGAPTPITITSLTASKSSIVLGDVVTFDFAIGAGTPTRYDYYVYTENNVLVKTVSSSSPSVTYTFTSSGKFKVMGVANDGYNWASAWCSSLITVENRLSVSDVKVDATSKVFPETMIITPTFLGGRTVQQVYYEVYDAATNKLVTAQAGKTGYFTYTPPYFPQGVTSLTYKVMVIVTDGVEWASKYSDVVTYTKPTKIEITSIIDNAAPGTPSHMIELGQSLTFRAEITNGAPLRSTEFQILRKVNGTDVIVDIVSGNSTTVTFTPDSRGEYRVMFVAYDGIDWVAKYSDYVEVTD